MNMGFCEPEPTSEARKHLHTYRINCNTRFWCGGAAIDYEAFRKSKRLQPVSMRHGSSVGIATGYRLEDRGGEIRISKTKN
jgi:hypothetical protein